MLILLSSTIKTISNATRSITFTYYNVLKVLLFLILNFSNLISKKNHFRLHTQLVAAYCPLVPTIDLKSQDLTVPPNFRLVELSSCTNELNIFSLFSTLIPRPVSLRKF
jgi:hypothetical protein